MNVKTSVKALLDLLQMLHTPAAVNKCCSKRKSRSLQTVSSLLEDETFLLIKAIVKENKQHTILIKEL